MNDRDNEPKYNESNENINDNFNKFRSTKTNNYFCDENIKTIQDSIQKISKKIEEDKMSLRILQERHTKRQSEYNQLAGKPIIKTKDQKLEEMKQKMEKLKNHKIFDPNYGKKQPILQPDDETKMIQKNTDKCKVELDNLIDAINKQVLYNSKLSHEIEEIRKEKNKIFEKIEKIEEENKKIEEDLEKFQKNNKKIYKKIQFKELNKAKEKGRTLETQFLDQRDYL